MPYLSHGCLGLEHEVEVFGREGRNEASVKDGLAHDSLSGVDGQDFVRVREVVGELTSA